MVALVLLGLNTNAASTISLRLNLSHLQKEIIIICNYNSLEALQGTVLDAYNEESL